MNIPNQAAPVMRNTSSASFSQAGITESDFCTAVVVNNNGQVCVNIPVLGQKCIPLSTPLPHGTAASACVHVCTKFGLPTGACITVTALGHQVAHQCIGKC